MCLASSDSLFYTALTTPPLPPWGQCKAISASVSHLPWLRRTIPHGKKKAEMYWTLGLGVCEHVWRAFQGTGSHDGVPGWEESLRPSKPVL